MAKSALLSTMLGQNLLLCAMNGSGTDAVPHLPASIYPDGWSESVWDSTLRTNLLGPVRMTEALLPHLPDGRI